MPLEQLNDEQMAILLDFADRCRHLCFGRPPTGEEADIIAYKEWKELARDLNYAGHLPWKSGKEWKMYWTDLKNRTKGKVGNAKRRSKFTGAPLKLNLNCWEQRIIELAELAAKEPRLDCSYDENMDNTFSLPDEKTQPKFESTPNISQLVEQHQPLDMSSGQQLAEQMMYIGGGAHAALRPSSAPHTATPQMNFHQSMQNGGHLLPPPPLHHTAVPPPLCASETGLSQLSGALHALARANMSIADALHALCARIDHTHP